MKAQEEKRRFSLTPRGNIPIKPSFAYTPSPPTSTTRRFFPPNKSANPSPGLSDQEQGIPTLEDLSVNKKKFQNKRVKNANSPKDPKSLLSPRSNLDPKNTTKRNSFTHNQPERLRAETKKVRRNIDEHPGKNKLGNRGAPPLPPAQPPAEKNLDSYEEVKIMKVGDLDTPGLVVRPPNASGQKPGHPIEEEKF